MFNWLRREKARPRPVVTRPGPAPVRPPIAIVTTFFSKKLPGKIPMWTPAFYLSCRTNPDIDFFVYTNLDLPPTDIPNLRIMPMTVPEFEHRATEAMGTRIEVHHHLNKLADLKPVYGLIFADHLKEYAFWAYSDFDLVWGDVRAFMTDSLLHANDIVSSRTDRLCGHFTLIRNTPQHNRVFELIPDVYNAMTCPTHMRLDEPVLTRYIKEGLGEWPLTFKSRVYWKSNWTIDAKYQRDMGDGPNDCLRWRDGKAFNVEGQEMMYLHFHKLKQTMTEIDFGLSDAPAAFKINRQGIFAVS